MENNKYTGKAFRAVCFNNRLAQSVHSGFIVRQFVFHAVEGYLGFVQLDLPCTIISLLAA